MASKQTDATRRYQNKIGMVAKSYKLKSSVVEEFAAACQKAGKAQAAVLTEFMMKYIDEINEDDISGNE